jgi:predicted DNA-binding antitoxin AbrB/MazE fold protein
MVQSLEATYENGVLKPRRPIEGLSEHEIVAVTIQRISRRPFDGWEGGISNEDATVMRRVIDEEFEQVDPDDWK